MGHQGGVMCIEDDYISYGNNFFSAGNDGSIKVWDIRKYECLGQIMGHKAKYGESTLTI